MTLQAFEKLMSFYGYALDACMIAAVTETAVPIAIYTYGKKYQWVPDSALDCTVLTNPYHSQALRELTGLDQKVQAFVSRDAGAEALIKEAIEIAYKGGEVHLFCLGGKHRSVAIAEIVARRIQLDGKAVKLKHNSPKMVEPPTVKLGNKVLPVPEHG